MGCDRECLGTAIEEAFDKMCGIFGVVPTSAQTVVVEGRLMQTAAALRHRGPDSEGIHSESGIGLAQTRLALVDLDSRSSQPFWDENRAHCLVYNGEIYNFRELRSELEREGVAFRTTSDTEVVLDSILTWGAEKALSRFEGMFALAMWSTADQELLLARDRFGIKPLFIADGRDGFVFSSEIHAMRPWIDVSQDLRTVIAFLNGSGGPMSGQTFLEGVDHVDPGTLIRLRPGGQPEVRRFADVAELVDPEEIDRLATLGDDALCDELEAAMQTAVDSQLMADAPVGVLCSGGVDSSLILGLAARSHDDLAVFHADVVGPTSERSAATALADHLGLRLEVVEVRDDDFLDLLPELSLHHGSPFHLNPHSVPFFRLSQLVRSEGVKGVLSGEGADETFLGYPWLAPGRTQRATDKSPANPSRTKSTKTGDLVTGMLERFRTELDHVTTVDRVGTAAAGTRADEAVDLLHANLQGLLHRNDSMGMAASIESRFPYLDSKVVSLGLSMGESAKIRRRLNLRDRRHPLYVDKWALRRVAERFVPPDLSRRPKVPFATTAYGRLEARPSEFEGGFVAETFRLGSTQMAHLFHEADRRMTSKLVHLEVWGRVMVRGEPVDDVKSFLSAGVALRPA